MSDAPSPLLKTISIPTDTWREEPNDHIIQFCAITGWSVRRVGSECAEILSDKEALSAIEYWKWLNTPIAVVNGRLDLYSAELDKHLPVQTQP